MPSHITRLMHLNLAIFLSSNHFRRTMPAATTSVHTLTLTPNHWARLLTRRLKPRWQFQLRVLASQWPLASTGTVTASLRQATHQQEPRQTWPTRRLFLDLSTHLINSINLAHSASPPMTAFLKIPHCPRPRTLYRRAPMMTTFLGHPGGRN